MKYFFLLLIGCTPPVVEDCYDESFLLASLINSEADTTDLLDMSLVASVVLNRVDHHLFPCSLGGVIFDEGQFVGAETSRFKPTQRTLWAAHNIDRDTQVIFFIKKGQKFTFHKELTYVRSSSVHNFYKLK
jgi:Cell Wall Hydrolase